MFTPTASLTESLTLKDSALTFDCTPFELSFIRLAPSSVTLTSDLSFVTLFFLLCAGISFCWSDFKELVSLEFWDSAFSVLIIDFSKLSATSFEFFRLFVLPLFVNFEDNSLLFLMSMLSNMTHDLPFKVDSTKTSSETRLFISVFFVDILSSASILTFEFSLDSVMTVSVDFASVSSVVVEFLFLNSELSSSIFDDFLDSFKSSDDVLDSRFTIDLSTLIVSSELESSVVLSVLDAVIEVEL